jgi:hypothetical protein
MRAMVRYGASLTLEIPSVGVLRLEEVQVSACRFSEKGLSSRTIANALGFTQN